MKSALLCFSLIGFAYSVIASPDGISNQCDHSQVKATYTIEKVANAQTHQTSITLLRSGNHVAHIYHDTGITEMWYLNSKQQIKTTRFFDQHQRAIEYQPGEGIQGEIETDWSRRYQIIADNTLNKLQQTSASNQGCQSVVFYASDQIKLEWLPQKQLIQNLEVKHPRFTETWELTSLSLDKTEIAAEFAVREQYLSTDYADIGDDHTDPFLTQMVNLGFIEGGASGFYNDQGDAIQGEHSHKHHGHAH
ncbi:MAG: hypothetical protein GJ671_10075 [Alteromonadaceae bacterium]|nr:hypothetical protein [Alteromonadaceae bacterium]